MTGRPPAPELSAALAVPPTMDLLVGPDRLDINGHMGFRHYFDLASEAMRPLFEQQLEVDGPYRLERRLGFFVVEHRLRYLAEVHAGHRVTAHAAIAAVGRRSMEIRTILVNRTTDAVSYVMDAQFVHIDLRTRASAPFPPDLERRLRAATAGAAEPAGRDQHNV
ncbi:hypothetical protein GIS00_09645 [Nakamurella sp. YIM 132087]|uniref:Thioesterase n=1 Tax=Nakamurella alba TaxID=2665158 RepID=A0A7K1FJD6_9ACTN|nr:thioesterase family protein [Nakamurella alba]MTD14208.1 hypothetical protein [Nakamurella alba]